MPSGSPEHNRIEIDEQARPAIEGLACNGCRKAKLRCSRDRPICLHCRKTGLECIYETKRIKPGLKPGAVENLHRRLDNLERRIEATHPKSAKRPLDDADDSTASVSCSDNESAAYDILALLARELPKLVGRTAKRSSPTPMPGGENYKRQRQSKVFNSPSSRGDAPPLPGADRLELILTAYFTHVHPWIPMVHQGRFLERLENETERDRLLIVIHAMILAASKFVPGASVYVHAHARRWVICSAMDSLLLENLQALIIIAFNDFGDGNAEKAWSIIGSMTRTVEYAQLTQEQEEGDSRPFSQPYTPLTSTGDWTELEERRRVFWNVFLLDRLCSVTTAWNTSLTSDDVYRRLPCDGHFWRKQEPILTPLFGIWDKSKGRIGNPIGFMSRHPSPGRNSSIDFENPASDPPLRSNHQPPLSDMSTVGAFAYNIEATESMSRVMSYFLQQKVDMRDQNNIGSWLTRFKELDLRLVHWKMLLPQKWKANPNLTRQVALMDPNLTTAHVTHNASMILLHQTIAYPPLHWGFRNRLPSGCSAEACFSAGVEIATITKKYLSKSLNNSPIGSQYAFCIFIAARVLLMHWHHEPRNQLPAEFWSLVQSLEDMSVRWCAFAQVQQDQDLFAKYATRLKDLYDVCSTDPNYQIDVMDYTNDIHSRRLRIGSVNGHSMWPMASKVPDQGISGTSDVLPSNPSDTMDFTSIPQIMLDPDFVDLDRVIAFDDGSMFTAGFDAAAASGW